MRRHEVWSKTFYIIHFLFFTKYLEIQILKGEFRLKDEVKWETEK